MILSNLHFNNLQIINSNGKFSDFFLNALDIPCFLCFGKLSIGFCLKAASNFHNQNYTYGGSFNREFMLGRSDHMNS